MSTNYILWYERMLEPSVYEISRVVCTVTMFDVFQSDIMLCL